MAKTVYGPNNEPHDFPDDMSDDDIVGVMKKTYGGPEGAAKPANPYREALGRFEAAQTPEERDVLRKEISALDPGGYKGLNSVKQIDDFDRRKGEIEKPSQGWFEDNIGGYIRDPLGHQAPGGYYGRRAGQGLTMSWGDEIASAAQTVADAARSSVDKPLKDFEWRKSFNDNQAVQEALNRKTNEETAGVGGFAAELAGGIAMPAGFIAKGGQAVKAAATTGYQGFKEGVKSFLTKPNLTAAAKTGAVFGGIDAAGRSEGGLEERAVDGAKGAVVGAAIAPVIGAGLAGGVGAYAGRQAGKAERAVAAGLEVEGQRGAGLAGDFGPTVTDSGVAKWAAPRIANSWLGSNLRERAAKEVDATLGAARTMFARESQGRSSAELGEEIQDTIRDSFMKKGNPGENPAALGEGELLHRADADEPSAFLPDGTVRWNAREAAKVNPTVPKEVPLQAPKRELFPAEREAVQAYEPKPKLLPREHFDTVHDDVVAGKTNEMNRASMARKAFLPEHNKALKERDDAYLSLRGAFGKELQSFDAKIKDFEKRYPEGLDVRTSLPLIEMQAARRAMQAIASGDFNDDAVKMLNDGKFSRYLSPESKNSIDLLTTAAAQKESQAVRSMQRLDEMDRHSKAVGESIVAQRQKLYDDYTTKEIERAATEASDLTMLARIQKSEASAQREAQERTAKMRAAAQKDAETDTAQRQAQQQADLERKEALRRRERLQGRTYRDEQDAAYELAGRMIPEGATANPLGRSHVAGDGPSRTGVTDLLDEFAADAKLKLLHRGYKGDVFGKDGVGLDPIFESYLRGKLGSDVADPLASYAALRNDMLPHARKKLTAQEKRLDEVQERRLMADQDRSKADVEAQASLQDSPRFSDEEAETVLQMWDFVRKTAKSRPQTLSQWVIEKGGVKDVGGDVRFMTGDKRLDRRMVKPNGNSLDDMALRAWENDFIVSTERPTINQFLSALDDDLRGGMVVRQSDAARLEDLRVANEMRDELGRLGIDGSKGNREQLRGWLTGKWSGEQQHQMKLETLKSQEDEILAAIGKIKEDGKATQFDVQTLHDFRSKVRGLKDEVSYSRKIPGQLRTEDEAMLSRLDAVLTKEISKIKQALGPEGIRADRFRRGVDQALAERIETLRKPLESLFKGKVEPLQALDRLVSGAQRGDDRMIRAYMKVMTEVGESPMLAASTVMQHATSNANSLDEFMKGASSIPKHIRNMLFASPEGKQYLKDLDVLIKHGDKLLPFKKAIRGDGTTQTGDVVARMGSAALTHGVGYGIGGLYTVVGQLAGTAIASRMMASPKYVNWLTKMPRGKDFDPTSAAVRMHINKLSGLAADDDDDVLFNAMSDGISELWGIKPAAAMIVGEKAKGIDKQVLATAKQMEADGKDRDAIWKATGWYKGEDDKWRMEIDDSDSEMTDAHIDAAYKSDNDGKLRKGPLQKFLKHDKLYNAHPSMKKIKTEIGPMPIGYEDSAAYMVPAPWRTMRVAPRYGRDFVLHEAQHDIQQVEGFDYGSIKPADLGDIRDASARASYDRLPGEAEAANTQRRASMTAEERWARPPWETLDVPEGELMWSRRKKKQVADASDKSK